MSKFTKGDKVVYKRGSRFEITGTYTGEWQPGQHTRPLVIVQRDDGQKGSGPNGEWCFFEDDLELLHRTPEDAIVAAPAGVYYSQQIGIIDQKPGESDKAYLRRILGGR